MGLCDDCRHSQTSEISARMSANSRRRSNPQVYHSNTFQFFVLLTISFRKPRTTSSETRMLALLGLTTNRCRLFCFFWRRWNFIWQRKRLFAFLSSWCDGEALMDEVFFLLNWYFSLIVFQRTNFVANFRRILQKYPNLKSEWNTKSRSSKRHLIDSFEVMISFSRQIATLQEFAVLAMTSLLLGPLFNEPKDLKSKGGLPFVHILLSPLLFSISFLHSLWFDFRVCIEVDWQYITSQ